MTSKVHPLIQNLAIFYRKPINLVTIEEIRRYSWMQQYVSDLRYLMDNDFEEAVAAMMEDHEFDGEDPLQEACLNELEADVRDSILACREDGY